MKHFIYLLLLSALALTSVQCSDEAMEFQEYHGFGSRGIAPDEPSETNPTLLTDWENCKTIKLNQVSPNWENIEVTLPWQNGANTALNSNFCEDIKSADGWTMLFHTFCKSNVDVDLSYMCFYNKFTGYLKVFYYSNEKDDGTSTIWNLSSADCSTPQPLFADLEYFSQPIEGDNTYSVWSATADNMMSTGHTGLSSGWNGFEFRIGEYHPKNATNKLSIMAFNTAYTNIKIDGVTESTTNGTITTTNSSESSGGKAVGALASLGGSKAKDLVDSIATKHLDKSFLGINFKNLLTSIAKNDYISAFKSGLGFIFKGLFKQTPTVQEVKLQTNGTITLQGSAESPLTSSVKPLTFSLDSVLSNDNGTTALGIWNLRKKPIVYYNRYTKFENFNDFTDDEFAKNIFDFNGAAEYPATHINNSDIEIVFNPDIKGYVKSYSATIGLIDVTGGNRVLNNKGKNIIEYNPANIIKRDSGKSVYGITPLKFGCYGLLCNCPMGSIDENTEFHIDWGENVGGNRAAVVTLTMDIDYNGKHMSFTESRVYDVIYKPYSTSSMEWEANNPPHSIIINQEKYQVFGFRLPTVN